MDHRRLHCQARRSTCAVAKSLSLETRIFSNQTHHSINHGLFNQKNKKKTEREGKESSKGNLERRETSSFRWAERVSSTLSLMLGSRANLGLDLDMMISKFLLSAFTVMMMMVRKWRVKRKGGGFRIRGCVKKNCIRVWVLYIVVLILKWMEEKQCLNFEAVLKRKLKSKI